MSVVGGARGAGNDGNRTGGTPGGGPGALVGAVVRNRFDGKSEDEWGHVMRAGRRIRECECNQRLKGIISTLDDDAPPPGAVPSSEV